MKNLKKVLALGLALVMILGMFTVAAAAETKTAREFPDWADVEHKDAFGLMVDLGVINGTESGTLAPKNNIDRASWAKMLYYVLQGDDGYRLYASDYPSLKDIQGTWAQGAIEYLYSNGYVSGDQNLNYFPTNSITVVEAAKTMLTALGYASKVEGYEGAGWTTNVITAAKNNGLLDGIEQGQAEAITRDNATQMIYNAMTATTVVAIPTYNPNTDSYVPSGSYNTGDTLGVKTFGIEKVTALVTGVNDNGNAEFTQVDPAKYASVLEDSVKANAADIGNSVTVWVKGGKSVVSDSVISNGSSADKIFTDGVTIANITNKVKGDEGHYVAPEVTTGTVLTYENGVKKALAEKYNAGNVVEVYLTGEAVSMIKVTTYSVTTVDGAPETRTYKDELQVKVPGIVTTWKAADDVIGYEGLDEGDVVLVNTSNGVVTLEKADVVNGTVSHRSGAKLTVNGKQYVASGIKDETVADFSQWKVSDNKDSEYDFYLDKNGDVCHMELVSGEVTTEVAYVLNAGYFESTQGSGLSSSSSSTCEAELLFTDCTTKIVTVASIVDGKDEVELKDAKNLIGKFVDFSVNSKDKYELSVKATTGAEDIEISAASDFTDGKVTVKADNGTVFLVAKGSDDEFEFTTYTGYKTVPSMTASVVSVVKNEDGVATYVYLETDKFNGEGSDGLIYVIDANSDEEDDNGNRLYEVVDAEGNEVTMALVAADKEAVVTGFMKVTSIDEDGVATVAAHDEEVAHDIKVGNGIITVNGETCEFDSATVAVIIDIEEGEFMSASPIAPKSIKTEEGYSYDVIVMTADGVAQYVYIIRTVD